MQKKHLASGYSGPMDELVEVVSFWAVIWGAGIIVAGLVGYVIASVSTTSWMAQSLVSVLVLLFKVGAATLALERNHKLKDAFHSVVRRWRVPVAMLLAGLIGYHVQAMHEFTSERGESKRAAFWACAQLPDCIQKARDYGERTGLSVQIDAR